MPPKPISMPTISSADCSLQALAAIYRVHDVMASSVRRYACGLPHDGPFVDLAFDELGELRRRAHEGRATGLGELGRKFRVSKRCVDFPIELLDNRRRCPRGCTDASHCARFIARHRLR